MTMFGPDLWSVLERLDHSRLLVLGDYRLERWTWGDLAPGENYETTQRLCVRRRELRPSGGARVSRILADLEADALCAGLLDDGVEGAALAKLLAGPNIDVSGLPQVASWQTPCEERFVGSLGDERPAHVWSVEEAQRQSLAPSDEVRLGKRIQEGTPHCAGMVIAGRGDGICTPSVVCTAIESARAAAIPVIAGPVRGEDLSSYRGATALVLSGCAVETAIGVKIHDPEDALKAGATLCRRLGVGHVFVSVRGKAIVVTRPQGRGQVIPLRGSGSDDNGAADVRLAVIALSLASGVGPADAARLAAVAEGLFVEYGGGRVISRDLLCTELMQIKAPSGGKVLSREDLSRWMDLCRERKQRIVFTNGCFDLLHAGHVTYLQEAAALGDVLVVGLNSDSSVRGLKGPTRPVIRQEDRATLLAALACVNYVVVFDDPTPSELIHLVRPDVLVKGGDYKAEQVVGYDFVQSYGGRVYIAPLVEGVSTTKILKSMAA